MSNKGTFHDLIVWQKAISLTKVVYRTTQAFPDMEKFGLVTQMRRAAVSVASNIAEGNARQSLRDYLHFLGMARGSLAELETQVIIAHDLAMVHEPKPLVELIRETRRILQGLMDSLRKKQQDQQTTKE